MCPLLQSSMTVPEMVQHKPSLPRQPRHLPQGLGSNTAVQGKALSKAAGAHRLSRPIHA